MIHKEDRAAYLLYRAVFQKKYFINRSTFPSDIIPAMFLMTVKKSKSVPGYPFVWYTEIY